MRIKKIELIGFKSFKDRTVIQLDAGITGIVGPNGCGKSNIVDALLWAMGEMSAKDLRGTSMMDVIFSGSEDYAPAGMAEVSITLENDGGPFPVKYLKYSELMVTRRLHRNGESEYFINKEPARLRDIQEIFMDTGAGAKGFSIIQQGMITKIILAKPEDRKHLIEEAAGITKFKARKKESQRRLDATEQNLVRLRDIIGELKRQIDSLQRQAQKAERYRNLKTQVEELDLWLSSVQYRDLKNDADESQRVFSEAQGMEVEGESMLAEIEAKLQTLKLQVLEQEQFVEETQMQYSDMQSHVQKKQLEIQKLESDIELARNKEEMTGTLFQTNQARRELLGRDLQTAQSQSETLKIEAEKFQAEWLAHKETFEEAQSRIHTVDEDLTTKRRELFAVGGTVSSMDARVQSLESQAEDVRSKEEEQRQVLAELTEKQIEFQARRTKVQNELEKERQLQFDLSNDVESFETNKKILSAQIEEKESEVQIFKDHLNEVTGTLYGLENLQANFEGFEEGVKQVMLWQKSKQQEVHADGSVSFRPVSEVVEVPGEYEVAMEAALGSRLQMLLSSDVSQTLEAVDYLKEKKSGRGSFFAGAVTEMSSGSSPVGAEGVETLLKDVIRYDEKFTSTVTQILDRVAVVDSIRSALRLRADFAGWTFVTKDGDVLSADGVLTGGSSEGADSGVLKRRREIKELTQRKEEWAGKLALAQVSLKKLQEQLSGVVNDFEGAQKRKVEQEIKVAGLKKDLERAETELENAGHAKDRQERELARIGDQVRSLEDRIEELNQNLTEARLKKAELEQETEALDEELTSTRMGFDAMQTKVSELQVQAATKAQELGQVLRQLDTLQRQVSELDEQLSHMNSETQKYSVLMSESQLRLEQEKINFERAIDEVENLKQEASLAKNTYETLAHHVRELEEKGSQASRARNERQHKMNEAQLKFEQAKMKEQYLIDQIRERYMLNLPDIYAQHANKEGDLSEAETQLKDLRDRLGRFGDVNLSAIEEYDETAKRYEFLVQQEKDLEEAKEQLRRVIDRINRICSRRFKETFDLVNERFQKVFPVLFGGGEASLNLIEIPEKQEMGIDIIAKPPGKKPQSITLLSGGEKALTAVALVFSIFLVKPSPYCLLDEVDAPLDDANVFRFNDLVKEMAKRSQIIVVTHNKHTMEVAAKLYGVTQQERGVSTMVSVNLQDL